MTKPTLAIPKQMSSSEISYFGKSTGTTHRDDDHGNGIFESLNS